MKALLALALERSSMVLDTGHHVKYIHEKQVQQQLSDTTSSDLNRKFSGQSRLLEVEIQRSNDRKPMVLDPGENLTPGVRKFHVEHEAVGREAAGHVVIDKIRCLCDYLSGTRRFWSEYMNLDLYRCSITKMANYSICVVAVEALSKAPPEINSRLSLQHFTNLMKYYSSR